MSDLGLYDPSVVSFPLASEPVTASAARAGTRHRPQPDTPSRSGGLTTSGPGTGTGGGGGFSLSSLAILLALIGVIASPFLERVLLAPVHVRSVPFVSLLERPG
jgi:hypothetical protein